MSKAPEYLSFRPNSRSFSSYTFHNNRPSGPGTRVHLAQQWQQICLRHFEEKKVGKLDLAEVFGTPEEIGVLKEDENLGRLNVTKAFQVTKDNNSNYTSLYSFGGRSFSILDPEHVVVGKIYGHTIVFVGIERISGIMVYDVSNPANPVFLDYVNNRNFEEDPESPEAGDLGTECLLFIPANRSPHKCPLVVAAHEIGGTTTVFQVNVTRPLENVDD